MLHGETPGGSFSDTELDAIANVLFLSACCPSVSPRTLSSYFHHFSISRLATALANPRTLIRVLLSLDFVTIMIVDVSTQLSSYNMRLGARYPFQRSKQLFAIFPFVSKLVPGSSWCDFFHPDFHPVGHTPLSDVFFSTKQLSLFVELLRVFAKVFMDSRFHVSPETSPRVLSS